MHEAARFGTCVERAGGSNPISWIAVLEMAVGVVEAEVVVNRALPGSGAPEPGKQRATRTRLHCRLG